MTAPTLPEITNLLTINSTVDIGDRIKTKEKIHPSQPLRLIGMRQPETRKGTVIQKHDRCFTVKMDAGYVESFFYEAIIGNEDGEILVKAY